MVAIVLSLLFGFIAFVALVEIQASVAKGFRRGRLIRAELEKTNLKTNLRRSISRETVLRRAPAAQLAAA